MSRICMRLTNENFVHSRLPQYVGNIGLFLREWIVKPGVKARCSSVQLAKRILLRILLLIERSASERNGTFVLSRWEARNLIALYPPKDVTTYGYYFLFSVSSSSIDLGKIPENRENISREGQREVMRILRPFLSVTFYNLVFRLARPYVWTCETL